jgi:YD repeat-containing protein
MIYDDSSVNIKSVFADFLRGRSPGSLTIPVLIPRIVNFRDDDGRLKEVHRTPNGSTTETKIADHELSLAGARLSTTLVGGVKQLWDYDPKGRVKSIESRRPDASVISRIEYADYDGRDRRRRIRYPLLSREVAYTYDAQDRLTSETWSDLSGNPPPPACGGGLPQNLIPGNLSPFTNAVFGTPTAAGGSTLYTAVWTYDGAGNRKTQILNSGAVRDYVYDGQNRLLEEQVGGVAVVSYGYDAQGNQTSRTEGTAMEQFTYDYLNRIETYTKPGTSFAYAYTPDGKRLSKRNLLTNVEEWFAYDGEDVCADYTRTSGGPLTLQRSYVSGRSIDSTLARIESNGAISLYLPDALGSIHAQADTNGAVQRQNLYTAWGGLLPGSPGGTLTDRYGFTAREDDAGRRRSSATMRPLPVAWPRGGR